MDNPDPSPTVIKRNGDMQPFRVSKIIHTMQTLSWGLAASALDFNSIVDEILVGATTQITSHRLQEFAATTISARSVRHPDYGRLAGRMLVANLHKTIHKSFVSWVQLSGRALGLDAVVLDAVNELGAELDNALVHARDFEYPFIGMNTLMHKCLLRLNGEVCERPQFMHMRIAIAIHGKNLARVLETYDALSRGLYTHATPVLYNGGTSKRNFASCFLYQPDTTSSRTLLRSVSELEVLWKAEGGVGMSLGAVPAHRSSPQAYPGILPLLRIYDAHASYVGMSGLRRPSAATVYLPIWHEEIVSFVQCRTSRTPPTCRVFNLYPAVWIPDLFMKRLQEGGMWTLFNPADVPALMDRCGADFDDQYLRYEQEESVPGKKIEASLLFTLICHAQRESGAPFLLYQDIINAKNNESHLGVVCSSNLCTEIVQFSSNKKPAVCTLASIALPRFVGEDGAFDFVRFHEVAKLVVRNLDFLIERAHYATSALRQSALRTRSLGIGVQGFADVLRMRGIAYVSPEAREFNREVFETLYHGCLDASCELAERGGSYPAWEGSPASRGILQMDMWPGVAAGVRDFAPLRERIAQYGLRNAMLTAQMPTASTAHVLGNSESTDPRISNITTHRMASGEYTEVCRSLVHELERRNLWSERVRATILNSHGSVDGIQELPQAVKDVYRTSWEIDPKIIIDMAAERGPFIDQSQSTSLSVAWPDPAVMQQLQLYAWGCGLKTGMYYLRCRPPTFPLHFGVPRGRPVIPLTEDDDDSDSPPPPLEPAYPLSHRRDGDEPGASDMGEVDYSDMPELVDVDETDAWKGNPQGLPPRSLSPTRQDGESRAVEAADDAKTLAIPFPCPCTALAVRSSPSTPLRVDAADDTFGSTEQTIAAAGVRAASGDTEEDAAVAELVPVAQPCSVRFVCSERQVAVDLGQFVKASGAMSLFDSTSVAINADHHDRFGANIPTAAGMEVRGSAIGSHVLPCEAYGSMCESCEA